MCYGHKVERWQVKGLHLSLSLECDERDQKSVTLDAFSNTTISSEPLGYWSVACSALGFQPANCNQSKLPPLVAVGVSTGPCCFRIVGFRHFYLASPSRTAERSLYSFKNLSIHGTTCWPLFSQ